METEQHEEATQLSLAGETVKALDDSRYEEAIESGRRALRALGIDANLKVDALEGRLQLLSPATRQSTAEVLTALAISSFRTGDYLNALQFAQLEHQARRLLKDDLGAAKALVGLGWCYQTVGLYQQALSSQFSALDTLERSEPRSVSMPLNGIARVYLDMGQSGKALSYARRSLEASRDSLHPKRDRATALCIIGQAHQANGDLQDAERAFRESAADTDDYGRSLALVSLAELCLEQGRYDEAVEAYQACITDVSPGLRHRFLSQAMRGLGGVYLARGEAERALEPLREAIARGLESGAPLEAAWAHRTMSLALKELGRYEEALEHFEAFHDLKDEALKQLSDRRTQILTVQLELERLERDREIDRLHNVELARAYAKLSDLHQKLEQQAKRLERLSRTDELTGLPNRRAFDERLEIELQRTHRKGTRVSVLMVDLDDFKQINDTYSHVFGDAVLRTTGQALTDCMREVDMCARIGGEEFMVLLPETGLEGAVSVGQKIVARVRELNLAIGGVHVTASVGVATLEDGDDEASLVARADANLYQAKREGKNRVNA